MSDFLWPHGLRHARLPCPLPTPGNAQTHIYWVSDAIQPSHPLSSPSPPAFSFSQHRGLFQWVSSFHQVAKVLYSLYCMLEVFWAMVGLKFKPKGSCFEWRLQIRNETQQVVLLSLLLMTFPGLDYPCCCSQFRLRGAGSWNGHYNSQSTWCSLLASTVGLRVWEGTRAGGCEGTRGGRISVIAGITVGTECQGQESWSWSLLIKNCLTKGGEKPFNPLGSGGKDSILHGFLCGLWASSASHSSLRRSSLSWVMSLFTLWLQLKSWVRTFCWPDSLSTLLNPSWSTWRGSLAP